MNNITLGRCFSEGLTAFKNYLWLAIGAYLLYTVISAVGGNIPFVNFLYAILVAFPLVGGFMMLFLNIVKGANSEIGQLFNGFSDWVRWMGVGWLLVLYMLVAMLIGAVPFLIFLAIAAAVGIDSGPGIFLMVVGGIASVVAIAAIAVRWMFVYYIAADEGATATEAIKKSAEMTEGMRPQLFWIAFVLALFAWVGVIALGVGVIVTSAISQCAMAALYLDVKQARAPAVPATPPSP